MYTILELNKINYKGTLNIQSTICLIGCTLATVTAGYGSECTVATVRDCHESECTVATVRDCHESECTVDTVRRLP